MKWWSWLLAGLAVAGLAFSGYVFYQVYSLEVEQVADDLYVLFGLGGNVAVLDTDEGTVIVDTMTLQYQGDRINEVATGLTGKPVAMIINTHYHLDHTHGNPAFEKGTRVVSTARTLQHLEALDGEYFSGAAAALLPNETFEHEHRITMGNKHLRLVWPGRGHTDGDLVVLFEEARIIHMGDLHFNRLYPNIDLEAGGSALEWADTIDQVLTLDFEGVIPGHGAYTDRRGLEQFQAFMRQLGELAVDAVDAGTPMEEFVATAPLTADAGYEEISLIVPIGLTREFVLTRAYEEARGDF